MSLFQMLSSQNVSIERKAKLKIVLTHMQLLCIFLICFCLLSSKAMPQTIFVTTALLEQFVDNDDELGLILGHEVVRNILVPFSFWRQTCSILLSIPF